MFWNAKNDSIEIEDTSVDYISFGKGKKNLILIPGLGEGLKTMKGMAKPFAIMYKKFAKDYKVYVFSRRNKLPEGFSTEDMANDLIRHMNTLGIEKADIVGVSQGGMIAEYIAINAPEKVNKLVLVVTVARANELMIESAKDWLEKAYKNDYKGIMIDIAERGYTEKYLKKTRKYYNLLAVMGKNVKFDRFIVEANACINHNAYDKLNKIKCPTLIIGAKEDKVLGIVGSEELAEKIKDSEIYVYEDYSHGVYEEAKDFNSRVLEFLRK